MTPEKLVEALSRSCDEKLVAVLLYGSAAAGDHVGRKSDFNILVVTTDLHRKTLAGFAAPTKAWMKAGNPVPLLFTAAGLRQATDVFPIELLDIKDSRKILYGSDPVADLEINTDNLRLEIEHELRGSLIKLRQNYVAVAGKPGKVVELMTDSLSTILVLFRAALRLYQDDVPARKIDALTALAEHIDFECEVFKTVQSVKSGEIKGRAIEAEEVFEDYLGAIEKVTESVDSFIKKGE